MKLVNVKSCAPAGPKFVSELPGGTFLVGRKRGRPCVVTATGDVIRLSDGKTVTKGKRTSSYEVIPAGTAVNFEA